MPPHPLTWAVIALAVLIALGAVVVELVDHFRRP